MNGTSSKTNSTPTVNGCRKVYSVSETDVSGNEGILRSLTAVTVTVVHLWPVSLSWTKPA